MSRRRQAKAPLLSASTKASLLALAAAAAVAWAVLWRETAATERVPPSHERRSRSEPDESRRSRSEPSRAAKPVPTCFDKDPARCASMRASCKDSPGWMFVNCAATCNACEMLDPAVRCRLDRFNQTSGLPEGGLDALFERMIQTADGQVEVLSRPPDGPWIVTIDGFLSDAQMEALVTTTMGKMERSTDDGAVSADGEVAKEVSSRRTSSNAWCMAGCEADRHVRALSGRIEALTGISRQHYEQYQVLRYDPSQRYVRHHDYVPRPGQTFAEPHGPRVLTVFLYLSDVESGGETAFTDLSPPIAILPKRGRALVWPSVLADDPTTQDARTHHEARPVGRGVKLAANTWIHLHDYRLPNLWGCTGAFEG